MTAKHNDGPIAPVQKPPQVKYPVTPDDDDKTVTPDPKLPDPPEPPEIAEQRAIYYPPGAGSEVLPVTTYQNPLKK